MQHLNQKKSSKQTVKNIKQIGSAFLVASLALSMAVHAADAISIYKGKPLKDAQLVVESSGQHVKFNGTQIATQKGDVQLQISSKKSKSDALTFSWKDTWYSSMTLEAVAPLDLSGMMKAGVLALDVKIDELEKGGISFKMKCKSDNCNRVVPFTMAARELRGKGWSRAYVPLSCFVQEHDDFSATTTPFALDVGGQGSVSFANVMLLNKVPKNASLLECPDYKTASITPGMLNEWWSIDWWLPRHEQKRLDAKAIAEKGGKIDLVFIGDSITQGWESAGAPVWEKHYANRNAFAIGFGGDRTENVLWRLQHGAVENMSPKLVVLMIGTNNTGHRYENPIYTAAGIKQILAELQQRLPNSKVLMLAIFPRDEQPEGGLRQINKGVNAIIKNYADNKRVFFADINSVFLTKEGVLSKEIMPDLLHPNEQGYNLWAEALEPYLQKLMNM
jgi:lysophospholipase L1-like esterase